MFLEEELLEIIKKNKVQLYKIAKSILNNEEDVNDAIQETLINAYKKIDTLKNKKYMETWVTRILINKCYDIIDKNKVHERKVQKAIETYNSYNSNEFEQRTIVQKAVSQIEEDLKLIVVMYYYNQFSVKEISEIMGIPTGTVKSKLSRARIKLYDILKREEEQGGE